ncbi:2-amino-4-hydroxy-6-hydroxymethyldihydropteridine diphosphokinase [Pseudomonas sp. EpS/L25]|uniref:2-amino-4-hydroxy-6- hydroxymethyldihydropteridine diphosphokinase n=1 Tax=Pseudomonas sp. EpS/L25 TaxID=1749078 RepID=UPI00074402A9|nr:2-amino-4-hydroxy-6-hydroxymethyldihydropteridine diphosphokinase [Pseudomonas sp. EpS/L25]KUM38737.1 2-amino-4-hydroxy-6-hydroxymethyldihydropteridine pyrophosphokinase [Pseudomonas sp. EpS/L25]
MTRVYLGLGSNVQREQHLGMALDELATLLTNLQCSPVFESEAVGIRSAPFLNLVVAGDTDLDPATLGRALKAIETRSGRYAPDRQGLPLDIDILLHGELSGEVAGLTLPRAEILRNAFVLWPLALLAGERRHPSDGRRFDELWQEMRGQTTQVLRPVSFLWQGIDLTPEALLGANLS